MPGYCWLGHSRRLAEPPVRQGGAASSGFARSQVRSTSMSSASDCQGWGSHTSAGGCRRSETGTLHLPSICGVLAASRTLQQPVQQQHKQLIRRHGRKCSSSAAPLLENAWKGHAAAVRARCSRCRAWGTYRAAVALALVSRPGGRAVEIQAVNGVVTRRSIWQAPAVPAAPSTGSWMVEGNPAPIRGW